MGFLSGIAGLRGMLIAAAVSAALAGAGGFSLAWKLQDAKVAKIELADANAARVAVESAIQTVRARDKVSAAADVAAVQHQVEIRTVYRTLTQKVPVYVTPAIDARYAVPVGFVRVFNAAAQGVQPDAIPDPAGRADDAPSGVEFSAVAGAVTDHGEAYHAIARQLSDLQDWVRAQAAVVPPH